MKPVTALRPPEPRKWDDGITWQQLILEGALPPSPAQCNSGRYTPAEIWPRVEGSLGRGIGQRRARFLIAQAYAKATHWTPPSWWRIEDVEAFTQTFTDDGEPAELMPETVKRSRSDPNAYALKKHHGLKFTVQIDGGPPDADAFVEYFLQWRHLTGDPALRKVMDHNRHLREQIEDLQARLKVLQSPPQ